MTQQSDMPEEACVLDVAACRRRQQRLVQWMAENSVEQTLVTQREHVQWLTGVYYSPLFAPVAALQADGRCLLVAPQRAPDAAGADEVLVYPAKQNSTLCNDQKQRAVEVYARSAWYRPTQRLATEYSTFPGYLTDGHRAPWLDAEGPLYRLRRRKESDELRKIRRAIAATAKMYQRAREIVSPGISELQVFNQLQSVAVETLGEPLTGTGNDYRCGARGGSPRQGRVAQAGELYILDLGPAFRGYFSDNCRTIAVSRPDDRQLAAWSAVTQVFRHIEATVRPGKNAQELFHEVQHLLDQAPVGTFDHHLGHGIGLFPHESPHLNPSWNDVFEEGEVFAVEPGLYADELRVGLRIENDYRVTATGVELLSDFDMALA